MKNPTGQGLALLNRPCLSMQNMRGGGAKIACPFRFLLYQRCTGRPL